MHLPFKYLFRKNIYFTVFMAYTYFFTQYDIYTNIYFKNSFNEKKNCKYFEYSK